MGTEVAKLGRRSLRPRIVSLVHVPVLNQCSCLAITLRAKYRCLANRAYDDFPAGVAVSIRCCRARVRCGTMPSRRSISISLAR